MQSGDYCFTNRDLIALANFGTHYTNCTPVESNLVEDAFHNLMGYSLTESLDRLTPQQLDRWTDLANDIRVAVVSGLARYVSPTGNDSSSGLASSQPKRTVTNAVASSSQYGGDIVLLRPGNYNERFTLTNPVTLRAAPTNSFPGYPRYATIGRP